jgi:hypothetical protein
LILPPKSSSQTAPPARDPIRAEGIHTKPKTSQPHHSETSWLRGIDSFSDPTQAGLGARATIPSYPVKPAQSRDRETPAPPGLFPTRFRSFRSGGPAFVFSFPRSNFVILREIRRPRLRPSPTLKLERTSTSHRKRRRKKRRGIESGPQAHLMNTSPRAPLFLPSCHSSALASCKSRGYRFPDRRPKRIEYAVRIRIDVPVGVHEVSRIFRPIRPVQRWFTIQTNDQSDQFAVVPICVNRRPTILTFSEVQVRWTEGFPS